MKKYCSVPKKIFSDLKNCFSYLDKETHHFSPLLQSLKLPENSMPWQSLLLIWSGAQFICCVQSSGNRQ